MRKPLKYIVFCLAVFISFSCGKDNVKDPKDAFSLNRDDIIGCWQVVQAKYDESAKMTDWAFEDTYATFEENGLYEGEGYFGNGSGTYSISGNVITTKVDNVPYIIYEVTGLEEDKSKAFITATLQKNQMKIWMVCQKVEPFNEEPPVTVIDDETFLINDSMVLAVFNGIYSILSDFSKQKLAVEEKLLTGDFSILSPENKDLANLWNKAYIALRQINALINSLENNGNGFVSKYFAHAHALRAFLAYNLTTLWGDIPYTTQPTPDVIKIWKSEDVLKSASEDIELYLSDYAFDVAQTEWFFYLNPTARNILWGEIKLAQGKPNDAKPLFALNLEDSKFQMGNIIFCFTGRDANGEFEITSLVYYIEGVQLLEKEANGTYEGLVESWKNGNHLGIWQMLKRIGKAEEITGCQKYQLLFPYPSEEAAYYIHQNEGY